MYWSVVMKQKATAASPLLTAFPSDSTSKVAKDINTNLWDRKFPPAAILINYIRKFL